MNMFQIDWLWIVTPLIGVLLLIDIPQQVLVPYQALIGKETPRYTVAGFVVLDSLVAIAKPAVLGVIRTSERFFQFCHQVLDVITAKPTSDVAPAWWRGLRELFQRKASIPERAGIWFSVGNLFYLCLYLRPDLILAALFQAVMDLTLQPLAELVYNVTPLKIVGFVIGLAGVGLYFYHTCFVDIFYGKYHDPQQVEINLDSALPKRYPDFPYQQQFHAYEQEVRLAIDGHIAFGGARASLFSFVMAVLSGRLQGRVRSKLVPAALFEYLAKHSPKLQDNSYAIRSALNPLLNPVGFSNVLALIAAALVTLSEAIAVSTSGSPPEHLAHQAAFTAGFLTILKKLGWIAATFHSRIQQVIDAQPLRTEVLAVQPDPLPAWQQWLQQMHHQWQESSTIYFKLDQWLAQRIQRLKVDVWEGMKYLYPIFGVFSLVVIEGEIAVSAYEQVFQPWHEGLVQALTVWGYTLPPLLNLSWYTLSANPEAIYRIGMAVTFLPGYWLYIGLSDHENRLNADTYGESDPTVDQIDWLLTSDWQWFWTEFLAGCENNRHRYARIVAAVVNEDWRQQICQYLAIQKPDDALQFKPVNLVLLSLKRLQSIRQQEQSGPTKTGKGDTLIEAYRRQLDKSYSPLQAA